MSEEARLDPRGHLVECDVCGRERRFEALEKEFGLIEVLFDDAREEPGIRVHDPF